MSDKKEKITPEENCKHNFVRYPPKIGKLKVCTKCGFLWAPGGIHSGERTIKLSGSGNYIEASTTTAPASPAAGKIRFYATSDTDMKMKNSAGTETDLAATGSAAPTGSVMTWLTDTAPTGWLLCYGQVVSRTTYADLFAVIGTVFGAGDGSTTFNLPDTRGRVLVGQDDMGGVAANRITAANAIGVTGGEATHTLTTTEMPTHSHTQATHSHSHTHGSHDHSHSHVQRGDQNGGGTYHMYAASNGGFVGNSLDSTTVDATAATPTADATTAAPTIDNAGGGGAHNVVQPYLTVNWIIKT